MIYDDNDENHYNDDIGEDDDDDDDVAPINTFTRFVAAVRTLRLLSLHLSSSGNHLNYKHDDDDAYDHDFDGSSSSSLPYMHTTLSQSSWGQCHHKQQKPIDW